MDRHAVKPSDTLESVVAADREAREAGAAFIAGPG